jgi:hypothetical protein
VASLHLRSFGAAARKSGYPAGPKTKRIKLRTVKTMGGVAANSKSLRISSTAVIPRSLASLPKTRSSQPGTSSSLWRSNHPYARTCNLYCFALVERTSVVASVEELGFVLARSSSRWPGSPTAALGIGFIFVLIILSTGAVEILTPQLFENRLKTARTLL